MAMRGIESQVMMQRTGEYVKEAALAQKRGEMNVEHAARRTEQEAQHFKEHIEKLHKKEDNALKNDLESQGGRKGGWASAQKRKQQHDEQEETILTDEENINIIDIRI